jgi:hypothetical protein
MHEAALKAQAKKMNVESLRAGDQSGESAEVKIAKVINCQGMSVEELEPNVVAKFLNPFCNTRSRFR